MELIQVFPAVLRVLFRQGDESTGMQSSGGRGEDGYLEGINFGAKGRQKGRNQTLNLGDRTGWGGGRTPTITALVTVQSLLSFSI